jgi:hypothetical protein
MSEIKHPIGSWEIVKTTNGQGIYEKGWGFVAIHDTSCHAHWNEGQAARRALIAAAPKLLEALQYALPYLEACVPNPRNGINADCSVDVNCVDRARAAISKATGGL